MSEGRHHPFSVFPLLLPPLCVNSQDSDGGRRSLPALKSIVHSLESLYAVDSAQNNVLQFTNPKQILTAGHINRMLRGITV